MAYCQQHEFRWAIPSAKLGLVDPEEVVEPYETRLSGAVPTRSSGLSGYSLVCSAVGCQGG